jgi:NAD(P)-dependent dehydrogenase (short-subunit alcohol dehydrogenase family)
MPTPPTIVITGATSGIGQLAAIELAKQGARLAMTARSPERAEATRGRILAVAPDALIQVFLADFARMDDVRRAGAAIADSYDRIDVLINNAGVITFTPRATVDGFPEMMAVNYLAPWLLTQALLPTLLQTPGSRVVTVASEASRQHGTLRLPHDLTNTDPATARVPAPMYGKTKLLDIMFTLELARRLAGTGVTANCLHPGFNATGLAREIRTATPFLEALKAVHIGDPARGARLIVKLATDPSFAGRSGGYYGVRGTRLLTPVAPAEDAKLRAQLWTETEKLLRVRAA